MLESGVAWQDKSYCMTSSYNGAVLYNTFERKQRNMIAEPIGAAQRGRYADDKNTIHHIKIRKASKSNFVTTVQKDTLICAPVRIGQYGKGGQGQRIEAERLQTRPDDYTAGIANTQRYKCIGNGWTVDVIAHILGGLKSER